MASWNRFESIRNGLSLLLLGCCGAVLAQQDGEPPQPARAEPARAEPARAEPARAEPARAEPARAEPARAEAVRAEAVPADAAIVATEVVRVEFDGGEMVVEEGNGVSRLESMVRVEIALLNRLFKLSEEQSKQLAMLDKDWVVAQANQGNPVQNVGVNVIGNLFGVAPVSNTVSVRERLRRSMRAAIAKTLTPEQNEQYEAEVKSREQFQAETTADCLVNLFENRLYLNAEQRQKLAHEFAKWRGIKELYIAFYMSNSNYLPSVPRSVMNKVLTKQQMSVVNAFQTVEITRDQFDDGEQVIMIAR